MRTTTGVAFAVAALLPAGLALAPGASTAFFKCGARAIGGPPVVVIDGQVSRDSAALSRVPAEKIASIDVTCSDTRHRVWGIEPGRDLIVIFTAPAPTDLLRNELATIEGLEQAQLAKQNAFASRADLQWTPSSPLATIDVSISTDRNVWYATASHRYLLPPDSIAGFSMTLERSGTGWSATCSAGCAWKTAVEPCRETCTLQADWLSFSAYRSGIQLPFRFALKQSGSGWIAESDLGTTWSMAAFGCAANPCRVSITERGISAP